MLYSQTLIEYLETAIKSFDNDPPDNPYQKGYLAALEETLSVARDIKESKDSLLASTEGLASGGKDWID